MASLVADYGTSSGSESEDDCSENVSRDEADDDDDSLKTDSSSPEGTPHSSSPKFALPTPDFNGTPALKTSVFMNPFVEAEKAKSAILEKHVKMTPTLDDTKMINGRKICWNYRKGRCRFGHNCTFAHDSDLHRSAADLELSRTPEETIICQTNYTSQMLSHDDDDDDYDDDDADDEVDQENNVTKRKKRPGLAQNLVPGKKVLKMYKAQQAKAVGR